MSPPDTILPHQLPDALNGRRGIRMLSLDCFDTLLWRDVNAPADLFGLLNGISTEQRSRAERAARKTRVLANRISGEVTLREIYAALLPHATEAEREARVEAEIAIEARHCYAFAPTVALMREAKRRGLRIVVVSDTYLEHDQLAGLIRAAAGDGVADLIDEIFCSCDHRLSKNNGLFGVMLRRMLVKPDAILHIGDNPIADAAAGAREGLRTLHLTQFTGAGVLRLRQEKIAGALMMPAETGFQAHRAAMAIGEPQMTDPGEALGFTALGPVLTSFAEWLEGEAEAIEAERPGRVHMLFLMRDGYLPREVFAAAMPDRPTHAIEISRFTAVAAGLSGAGAVEAFVRTEIDDDSGRAFLRQLLIDGDDADALLNSLPAKEPAFALVDMLCSEPLNGKVRTRGAAFADRLLAYLRTVIDPARGDTLMLVDLGYNGSVQNRIDTLLADRLGVHVAGRYLVLAENDPTNFDKRGMIDGTAHDDDALYAILSSIAVLEQLCTVSQGSVVDYRNDVPVRAEAGIKGRQSEVRDAVQAGCIAYARTYRDAVVRAVNPAMKDTMRRGAVAVLARLLFLPLPQELSLLSRFEHDANLGSDEKVALFDPDHATRGLRERGLFYLKGSKRMFLPAEVRGQGLPTSLTLLAQRRFGLDLRYADFCDARITISVLLADGQNAFTDTIDATPTHDGYYVAAIPVGLGRYTVGVQFGRGYEWLQIESMRFMPVSAFMAGEMVSDDRVQPAFPSCEGMEQVAPHLFRCDGPESFLMVPPPVVPVSEPMMLAVVFRPITARDPIAESVAPVSTSQPHAVS